MALLDEQPVENGAATETGASQARRAMIDSQLRVSGVNDLAILAAFAAVAREDFVPADRRAVAYADRAVPLGDGTVLAPALTHGQQLTLSVPTHADSVLVIGNPGTYLAALAGELAGQVVLAAPGADYGAPGAFSLILIDGAIEQAPSALGSVLADHGRMVTGLVERGVTRLAIGRKVLGELVFTSVGEADFAPLAEFAVKKSWSF